MEYKLSASYERMRGFYSLPKNTLDIVFIGTSHLYYGIVPMKLWEDYGITSYVLAQQQQIIECSYAYINEVLKYQSPKLIVLDIYSLLSGHTIPSINIIRKSIDYMKWGMNKLKLIEELMFMFIFHFDIEINNFSFILLKSIIDITKFDYHKELLINIIKIIQILNVKRNIQNASSTILYIIISNCSSCLSVILNFVNPEVKKIMYDFIKKNVTDYTLIYLLLINCNKDFNYSKVFSSEQVYDILDKYKTELEKKYFFLEKMLNSNKFDNTLSSKLQIKQIIDTLGAICKILDSFIYRGHRTYNVDKIIKNLIPLCQKIIILLSTKINDIDYNLSTESIQNILFFFQATNCLDTEKVLLLLHSK